MLFPRKDEVLAIHRKLIDQFGGVHGLRDEGLLDSALLAAASRQHYEGADIAACAATYAYHLTRNHPFVDGNKRIGAAVSEVFVQLKGGASVLVLGVMTAARLGRPSSQGSARFPVTSA